jgi:hypothetical protein
MHTERDILLTFRKIILNNILDRKTDAQEYSYAQVPIHIVVVLGQQNIPFRVHTWNKETKSENGRSYMI